MKHLRLNFTSKHISPLIVSLLTLRIEKKYLKPSHRIVFYGRDGWSCRREISRQIFERLFDVENFVVDASVEQRWVLQTMPFLLKDLRKIPFVLSHPPLPFTPIYRKGYITDNRDN